MQDPKTRLSSFDAPMGHTLSPVGATLPCSTPAQPQAPSIYHSLCGKSMQLLHNFSCGPFWTGWRFTTSLKLDHCSDRPPASARP